MKDFLLPHELPEALNFAPDGVKVLSLDCFDTLIWRNVHAPRDVFPDFGPGMASTHQRIWAESRARSRAKLRCGRNEVAIADIYKALLPNGATDLRERAVEAELAAEARQCFAFAPTVQLMKAAHARGLKIIIVSDTYFDERQLSALIRSVAGEDVLALIDAIFCSSEHFLSKGEGLFRPVLRTLKLPASAIFHIGDNKQADFVAPASLGVNTMHLRQFDPVTEQRLRLEATVSTIVHRGAAAALPTYQPHRAACSANLPQLADPAEQLGFAVLGPVMAEFADWLQDEADALAATVPGRVHTVFLMRDGHLPKIIFDACHPSGSAALELSRYTATAASLHAEGALTRYLDLEIECTEMKAIAKQLLLDKQETATLMRSLPRSGKAKAFAGAVEKGLLFRKIQARSHALSERLKAYVQRTLKPQAGDALMLVDLGYNGSVQNAIAPLLEEWFAVSVSGRYLILREQELSGHDKKGLIDARHYDCDTLDAFCRNVAVLEQLCTSAQGSVVDYTEEGEPVRAGSSIKSRQSAVRDLVQGGCRHYAVARQGAFHTRPRSLSRDAARQSAAAALARLMFLPLPEELQVLERFEHDVNLGVDGTVSLFDRDIAQRGLVERGLFYMNGAERMYLPAELRGHGLPLSLTLLTQHRFGLDLRHPDFCDNRIELPIIIADGHQVSLDKVEAHPTHDGYYVAAIPVGECRYAIGVQFGKLYDWVQVQSVTFAPVNDFLSEKARQEDGIQALISLEGMEQAAPHLLKCNDEASFMMIPPPQRTDDRPMMLAIAFRPIAERVPAAPASAPMLDAEVEQSL